MAKLLQRLPEVSPLNSYVSCKVDCSRCFTGDVPSKQTGAAAGSQSRAPAWGKNKGGWTVQEYADSSSPNFMEFLRLVRLQGRNELGQRYTAWIPESEQDNEGNFSCTTTMYVLHSNIHAKLLNRPLIRDRLVYGNQKQYVVMKLLSVPHFSLYSSPPAVLLHEHECLPVGAVVVVVVSSFLLFQMSELLPGGQTESLAICRK